MPQDTAIPATSSPPQSVRVGVSFRGRSHGQGRDGEGDSDLVTVEEPMELRLDFRVGDGRTEQSIAVTMRTPGEDFDLALGFLLGEGVIAGAEDVAGVEFCGPPSPDKGLHNTVKVTLADHVRFDAERLSRHVFTSSSCGVCGKATLAAVRAQIPAMQRRRFRIPPAHLTELPRALRKMQTEFTRTGGLHASACFDAEGRIRRVREDVGRHNALDKLIGSYLRDGEQPLEGLAILLSGRASFELIQKAAMTRAPLVAAIGPPSSLAIELAVEAGITLIGFLKADTFNVYVDPQGIP